MIAPNTLLQNRYLVLNQIGQGGMGAVYIATDQRFGSTVALKETFFTDPGLRKAFEREARLLNHLRHPALPRVSDHFTEEEGQFLVMEYIAGDDLAEKLKERGGAFTLSEVLNWADQLLDALDYLHTQEPMIIHRDIKPQNLKLTPRNAIVLLDFGLAKGTAAMQTKVTATASVFGYSRNYAPLEQIQGAGTDPRSDIYSLGATLYHLITGVTPPDALTRATAVLNGQPDPLLAANEVHAQVTEAVAEVLSKAMAQNASQRPQTAAAMREAMRDAARQVHSTNTSARDTNALPAAATSNVYEQDTQLMFAATPSTRTGEKADKTGTERAEAEATALNSAPATALTGDSESVLTKVAKSGPTALKSQPRTRSLAIAASVFALIAVGALVYSFTRNPQPAASREESVQSTPALPQASDAGNQNSQPPPVENGNQSSAPTTITTQGTTETAPTKQTKVIIKKGSPSKAGTTEVIVDDDDNEPPDPPDSEDVPPPGKRPRKIMRPGDPEFDEAMREAEKAREEGRRAAEEARRAAREQRRAMLLKQREQLLEQERRRIQQQRQQRTQP